MMDGCISISRVGDVCKIEVIGAVACDQVIAAIANIQHDAPEPSDADKICEALDEVTAELRNVREAIQYR